MSDMSKNETQGQEQEHRSYENSPWINVYDWMVTERVNGETGEKFWDVKLPSNTFLEMNGRRIDVGHYHFTCNREPSVTFGEPGTPKAMRGIHFPEDWDITLRKVENIAQEGQPPVFKETDRIEGVTPTQLSEAVAERNAAWRSSHKHEHDEKAPDKEAQSQSQKHMRPDRGMRFAGEDAQKPKRSAEPSL